MTSGPVVPKSVLGAAARQPAWHWPAIAVALLAGAYGGYVFARWGAADTAGVGAEANRMVRGEARGGLGEERRILSLDDVRRAFEAEEKSRVAARKEVRQQIERDEAEEKSRVVARKEVRRPIERDEAELKIQIAAREEVPRPIEEVRRRDEVALEETRRIAAVEEIPPREEVAVEEERRTERLIAAPEASRRDEETRKAEDWLRLASTSTNEERATYVRQIQAVLKRRRCYDGYLTGRANDAQDGLNRLVDNTNKIRRIGPRRIELANASVGDFQTWLRDANVIQVGWCPSVVKPVKPASGPASARGRPAEPQTPRYRNTQSPSAPSYPSGGMGLILGIGH